MEQAQRRLAWLCCCSTGQGRSSRQNWGWGLPAATGRREAVWLPKVWARSDLQTDSSRCPDAHTQQIHGPRGPLPAFMRGCLASRGRGSEGKGCLSSAALWEDTQESHSPPTGHSFTYSPTPLFIHSPAPSFSLSFMHFADSREIFLCGLEQVLVLSGL